MARVLRIGNACGFWGDRLSAASEMLARQGDLDFLTLDFLAEVSMSILALQRSRDPLAGWPRDFVEIVSSIAPYWRSGGRCRIITNAGGLEPLSCAEACRQVLQQAGCGDRVIAVVSGDDVLEHLRAADPASRLLQNLDTGEPLAKVQSRLLTANAYLGAQPIAAALARGADLVITGRVADPSLTVAACVHAFGWQEDDWDRLAGATVAGHLIECGSQVTGGIATEWLEMPDPQQIGFPVAEVCEDGSCVITKPAGTGGRVCRQTVSEQLVYEIADPSAYLSPDATVSLLSLRVDDQGSDRVRVHGARGRPTPPTYKVSATYQDGFWAQGHLAVFGADAVAKAQRAAQAVLTRLEQSGVSLRAAVIECLGAGACRPQGLDAAVAAQLRETLLRIAVADDSRQSVEQFSRELMPLVTAGPPGTTGYAEGRPRVHPLLRFWPCLIERQRVEPHVAVLSGSSEETLECVAGQRRAALVGAPHQDQTSRFPVALAALDPADTAQRATRAGCSPVPQSTARQAARRSSPTSTPGTPPEPRRLADIAYARSGDKGIHANIGLVARRPEDFPELCAHVTVARVAAHLGLSDTGRIVRYELPNLAAINLVIRGLLSNPLRVDAQGKALGQVLLEMPREEVDEPRDPDDRTAR